MSTLFEVKDVDRAFYEEHIKDFIPDKIIDVHTHVWLDKFRAKKRKAPVRAVTWPSRVAKDGPIEELIETYNLMFPGKKTIPLIFSSIQLDDDREGANDYIEKCAKKQGFPSLIFATPAWSGQELEERIIKGGFYGCKVYLNFAPTYLPREEIRIFDFLPYYQLEVLNKHGWVVMLHIPRDGRLKDPVNLAQMLEIEQRYPNIKLIIAHVGRAYCPEDIGNAFEVLGETKNMMFDISANTNEYAFKALIEAVGPKRVLFGSDLPIVRMRIKRICENGTYINQVPPGLYGDVSNDKNMRELSKEEGEKLTFFMYEEIHAFRCAAEQTGLSKEDVEDVFYNNAARLLNI